MKKSIKRSLLTTVLALLFCWSAVPALAADEFADPAVYGENNSVFRYVSPSGSDAGGNGTKGAPFQTPGYAASRAPAGSTIVLSAGVYTLSAPIELPVGVSLEGAGESTVLTSRTLTAEIAGANALVRLVSPANSGQRKQNGNQHISRIRFDGKSTATQAIEIQNRNNVAVHDCVIVDFVHVGVGWRATDMGDGTPPAAYVTGGRFYNNYMKDNSFYGTDAWHSPEFARGALFCGGLKDLRIYGNTIIEDCRTGADGRRGVPIKFWYYTGWMLGCRVHDNTIRRLGSPDISTNWNGWAFAIESAYHAGMEICNNDITGAVDLNAGRCGTYDGTVYEYATWIHGNRFTPDPTPKAAYGNATYEDTAIILEWRNEKTLIENNSIRGYNQALYFNVREGVYDFTFRNNICTELGGTAGSMFRMDGAGSGLRVENFNVIDNVFEGKTGAMSGFGLIVSQEMGAWSGRNITISGNAVGNTWWNWLVIGDYASIDGLTVKNNRRCNTGGEYRISNAAAVSSYVYTGNNAVGVAEWTQIMGEAAESAAPTPDPAEQGSELPFTDVLASDWFFGDVDYAYESGLVDGRTATTFAPRSSVTLAETVKLAACMHQLYTIGEVVLRNGSPKWYDSYVDYAVNHGMIGQNEYADWNKTASRAEFAAIVAHALPAAVYTPINAVADNAIPDVAVSDGCGAAVYMLYRAGILCGSDANGTFGPERDIIRGEVAAIVNRVMNQTERQAVSLPVVTRP